MKQKRKTSAKRKKTLRFYLPILASGIIIALTIVFLSLYFSSRPTYTVYVLSPDGQKEEISSYHSLVQAKQDMYKYSDAAKQRNGAIYDGKKRIALAYGVVNFRTKDCTVNAAYTTEAKESGYTNGCYGADGAYLDTSEDGKKILFRQAGGQGWVNREDVTLLNYFDTSEVASISHYQVREHKLSHKLTTNIKAPGYANTLPLGSLSLPDGSYFSYDGHYFYATFVHMIDDLRQHRHTNSVNKTPYYDYYQFLPHRSYTHYSTEDINWYIEHYLGFTSKDKKQPYASLLYHSGQAFMDAQNTYGTNAIMMLSLAMNESDFGRSTIAWEKKNLFGHAAYDASPSSSSSAYDSVKDSIFAHAKRYLHESYLNPANDLYHGAFFGDKAFGMNVRYASDPYWGEKAASYYRTFDEVMGQKDHKSLRYVLCRDAVKLYGDERCTRLLYTEKQPVSSFPILAQHQTKKTRILEVQSGMPIIKGQVAKNSAAYYKKESRAYIKERLTDEKDILQ